MSNDTTKFLHLTKLQAQGIVAVLFLVSFILLGYEVYKTQVLAETAANNHAALCTYKGTLTDQRNQTVNVLAMTRKEVIAKYGVKYYRLIQSIPKAELRQTVDKEDVTIRALSALDCN